MKFFDYFIFIRLSFIRLRNGIIDSTVGNTRPDEYAAKYVICLKSYGCATSIICIRHVLYTYMVQSVLHLHKHECRFFVNESFRFRCCSIRFDLNFFFLRNVIRCQTLDEFHSSHSMYRKILFLSDVGRFTQFTEKSRLYRCKNFYIVSLCRVSIALAARYRKVNEISRDIANEYRLELFYDYYVILRIANHLRASRLF